MEYVILNNGVSMPQLGIGTFLLTPQDAENAIAIALSEGYPMVDTANAYVNEKAVGRGIIQSKVKREDVFVSTKIWPSEYANPNAVDETLERLGLNYIDLLFLHQPAGDWKMGYRMLEKAYREGKIKAIGISNFEAHINELLSFAEIKPQVIQAECHPYFTQKELRKIIEKENIRLMSWYPLGGKGNTAITQNPSIAELGKKYGKSPAQVILRWHIQMGFIVIPGSRNKEHIQDNLNIFDFELSEEDMKLMESICTDTRIYTPSEENLKRFAAFQPIYEK